MALYLCPCGDCTGEPVAVEFVGGFAGTSCEVQACSVWRDRGMVSYTVRRSAPLGWTPADAAPAGIRHRDGLVTLTG